MKFFNFGNKKEQADEITAHVNIHVMLFGDYVNRDFDISVPTGTDVRKMLKIACQKGALEKEHYRYIKKLKHPFAVSVNGTIKPENPRHVIRQDDKTGRFLAPITGVTVHVNLHELVKFLSHHR